MGLDEESRFSELAEARPVVCGGDRTWWGRWKSQHRKKLCLSLLMSKNLKLIKVIKSFVSEPISSVFGFLYAYEHYEHSMNICTNHVLISGYVTGLPAKIYLSALFGYWVPSRISSKSDGR